jgi:hypothetical protein
MAPSTWKARKLLVRSAPFRYHVDDALMPLSTNTSSSRQLTVERAANAGRNDAKGDAEEKFSRVHFNFAILIIGTNR